MSAFHLLLPATYTMSKARLHAVIAGGSADEIESAFYEALRHADLAQLMACWAEDEEVVCIHPGGPRLLGLSAIRESFQQLLSEGGLQVQVRQLRRVDAGGCSIHSVIERLDVLTSDGPRHGHLLATNVYAKTPKGWRLLVHHVSPGDVSESLDAAAPGQTLH